MPAIIIDNNETCISCARRSCSIGDVIERKTFATFKTERYPCPLKILANGPDDKMLEVSRIDTDSRAEDSCIYCYLCVAKCSRGNLSIDDMTFETSGDFASLRQADSHKTNALGNMLAASYLNSLFNFAASTTLNRSVSFDGIVYDEKGSVYFVEVDLNDDSLESFRRLLGDIAMHNAYSDEPEITAGIMVLSNLPKRGSRDAYTLANQLKAFPGTSLVRIYVTTFQLLRHFMLNLEKNTETVQTLFFEIGSENPDDYVKRLVGRSLISCEHAAIQF